MFNVSDHELDGLESRSVPEDPEPFRAMPMGAFGDDPLPPPGPEGTHEPMPVPGPITPLPSPGPSPMMGAGKAFVYATCGLVVGALVGGKWGAAAGVTGVGTVRNLWRVKETFGSPVAADRSEALKSGTLALFGLGATALLGYQAYKDKTEGDLP